mgnify:CR=1 FL=1
MIDTNVFLEVLLSQEKKEECKRFLEKNIGYLHITDFSLHSIGVLLFRFKKEDIFKEFAEDVLPNSKLLSLPLKMYGEVVNVRKSKDLDFDDAYQYIIAKYYRLQIVTMDKDFEKIKDIKIIFL